MRSSNSVRARRGWLICFALIAAPLAIASCGANVSDELFTTGSTGSGGRSTTTGSTSSGTGGATGTSTGAAGTGQSTTSASTSTTGGAGGQAGTTGGPGGQAGGPDAGLDASAGGAAGTGGAGGASGAGGRRDASADGPCIAREGESCGGFVINPCRCADGLICQTGSIPDAPGRCVKPDANPPHSCVPQCNRCVSGICCGAICCNQGEWCDTSGIVATCKCGNGAACVSPATCHPFGPSTPFQCGDICCTTNCPQ
jgi:hypothetical protein